MSKFDEDIPVEQQQEHLKMEIRRLIQDKGLNNEQTQQTLREVLRGLTEEEQAVAKSPDEQPPAAAPEILKSTTMKLFMPQTSRERGTFQEQIGSFLGTEVEKGKYAVERLIINGQLSRRQLEEIAQRLGFETKLQQRWESARYDNPVFVEMDYQVAAHADPQSGFIIQTPYRGEEQEFSRLMFSGQGSPADVQISLDPNFSPLRVIIKAK